MSSYGDYQIIKEIGWSNGATLYSAQKGTEQNFAIKVFSLAFFGFAGDNDTKAAQFAELFNSRLENQKKASAQSPRFAPIFQEGFDNDEAWYVTRLYANSVQKLIESHTELRGQEFFYLISAIVEATGEFKKICGRSHGNVKATNVFLNKPGKSALNEIVLGDAAPGEVAKSSECELADLRGIGEIIHRLVINENREEEYWKLPPPPTLQEWVGIFGKDAEAWRALCSRLLEPDLTIQNYNLEELTFDVARLKPKPKVSQKQVFAMAALVLVLGIAAVFGIKQLGSKSDNSDTELRQKKIEEQASRLSKEKRAAEERANSESKAREQTERRSDAEAKRLAQERRLAEERASIELKTGEEARRKAEALDRLRREAAQKVAETERLISAVQKPADKRQSESTEAKSVAARPLQSSAVTKPSLREPWSNSLGMRFVPVPKAKVLFCAWETRRKDFEEFVRVSVYHGSTSWRATTFKQGASDPVVNVDAADANSFCKWLTNLERSQGLLTAQQSYRLPTDSEWSEAVGVTGASAGTKTFAWGSELPPPAGAGNFAPWCAYDRYAFTAPVAVFQASPNGLYDMAGNVWEICQSGSATLARGSSWQTESSDELSLLFRLPLAVGERRQDVGFRCVLDLDSSN
jgi:hypothetical protein